MVFTFGGTHPQFSFWFCTSVCCLSFHAFIPRSAFIRAVYRARQIVARPWYTFTYDPALLCSPSDIGGHHILSPGLLWVRKRDAQNFPSLPPLKCLCREKKIGILLSFYKINFGTVKYLTSSSRALSEPRGYSGVISHVGVDRLTETSINCHRTLSSTQSASAVGAFQRTERYSDLLLW